jgi:hypothetical protein
MEPTFIAEASSSTVTPALAVQIEAAVAALPAAYLQALQEREVIDSPDTALAWLQDWAFTKDFTVTKESASTNRVQFQCTYHKNTTKNWRKIAEVDRERVETKTQSRGCKFGLYISQ